MITVLFVSHTAELNGAELWLLQFLKGIDRTRFNPLLAVPEEGPLLHQARSSGVETIVIPFKWWLTERRKIWKQPLSWIWSVRSLRRLARVIDERRVDALCSNSSASFSGALAARSRRIPHIWAVHEILVGRNAQLSFLFGKKALIRLILDLSCRVIVSSRATGKSFGESEKVRLVYSGIELPAGGPSDPSGNRARFNISQEDVVLGVVGRICDEKGQREMIQAIGMLDKDEKQPKLLLAGRVTDERYFSNLKKLIANKNLDDRVIFVGFQKDIFPFLEALDCLFVASTLESFGRTIIEAMGVGTPVVAVRSGGIPEIINPGENGLLLESREPKALQAAIVSFLADRAAFQRAADAGTETVRKKFLLEHQIRDTEEVLEECLERN